jgi:hypothetical protein
MHPKDYRAQYAEEVERASASRAKQAAGERGTRELVHVINDSQAAPADRLGAVREASSFDPLSKPSVIKALLRLLSTPEEPDELRLAALTMLQQCSVQVAEFRPYAADFTTALRTATGSELAELREQAMDLLALHHDPYVQEMLVDGLRNPDTASVEPAKALRMLGYDVHAEHYGLLRDIVETSAQPQLRRMALKLLAADSGAKDTFARIAADRSDDPVARSTSAVALQALAPEEFDSLAKTIVADDDDHDDVRATVLSALAHNADDADQPTTEPARRISESPKRSPQLKAAARDYLQQPSAIANPGGTTPGNAPEQATK